MVANDIKNLPEDKKQRLVEYKKNIVKYVKIELLHKRLTVS